MGFRERLYASVCVYPGREGRYDTQDQLLIVMFDGG